MNNRVVVVILTVISVLLLLLNFIFGYGIAYVKDDVKRLDEQCVKKNGYDQVMDLIKNNLESINNRLNRIEELLMRNKECAKN